MPGTSGALLPPGFRATAPFLSARLGLSRTLARVRHLPHKRLMHQAQIRGYFENVSRKLDCVDFFANQIAHVNLHV
jgi:hypothetical protein